VVPVPRRKGRFGHQNPQFGVMLPIAKLLRPLLKSGKLYIFPISSEDKHVVKSLRQKVDCSERKLFKIFLYKR